MDNENRIEFYQNRSFGERLSAAADFLRQNWKVFYRNILIPAIPLVLLIAYLLPEYMKWTQAVISSLSIGDTSALSTTDSLGLLFFLVAICLSLYLYAMSGAIMKLYEEGCLTDKTSWNDLSGRMFSNAGKIFLIGLVMTLIIVVITLVAGFLIGTGGMVLKFLFVIIFLFGLIAIFPPSMLVIFPALFKGASIWESIKNGFSIGFKNWGSTFGVVFIAGIMGLIVSYVFGMPYQFWTLFNPDQVSVITYIFAILHSIASVLVTPFVFVFLAFQYFSITEKKEGISLQSEIDEFDNL